MEEYLTPVPGPPLAQRCQTQRWRCQGHGRHRRGRAAHLLPAAWRRREARHQSRRPHTSSGIGPAVQVRTAKTQPPVVWLPSDSCHSSQPTAEGILQTLLTLVSSPEGAQELVAVDDASALVEIAPSQPLVLEVFIHAFSQLAVLPGHRSTLPSKVNATVQSLVASFKGTDAVTLLVFLDSLLRTVDPEVSPQARPSIRAQNADLLIDVP